MTDKKIFRLFTAAMIIIVIVNCIKIHNREMHKNSFEGELSELYSGVRVQSELQGVL